MQIVFQSGHQPPEDRIEAPGGLRGKALFNFTSDNDEELSLQVWRGFFVGGGWVSIKY